MSNLEQDQKILLQFARDVIYEKLTNEKIIDKNLYIKNYPDFLNDAATFVTLTLNGHLRGCIGSLIPHTTLYDDLKSNAIKAAFQDPRFLPLTHDEFEQVQIEISLISPIEKVEYSDFDDLQSKIKPNIHGVILRLGGYQSTFLPQVWEQLPNFDSFMVHLFQKAGLNVTDIYQIDITQDKPEIYIYTVEKLEE